jgi:hypothetical protein
VLIHIKLPPFFRVGRDNRRRPIFWQRGSARLKLDCVMRKSRQPRCIAAISGTAAFKASKLLDADWNFSQAVFRASSPACRRGSRNGPGWQEVEQAMPAA